MRSVVRVCACLAIGVVPALTGCGESEEQEIERAIREEEKAEKEAEAEAGKMAARAAADPNVGPAEQALQAKIEGHFAKLEDGWTSEREDRGFMNTAMKKTQFRDLKFRVEPDPVSDADRLNGIEWKGRAVFAPTSRRTHREKSDGGEPAGWTEWGAVKDLPGIVVLKRGGEWQVEDTAFPRIFDGAKPKVIVSIELAGKYSASRHPNQPSIEFLPGNKAKFRVSFDGKPGEAPLEYSFDGKILRIVFVEENRQELTFEERDGAFHGSYLGVRSTVFEKEG